MAQKGRHVRSPIPHFTAGEDIAPASDISVSFLFLPETLPHPNPFAKMASRHNVKEGGEMDNVMRGMGRITGLFLLLLTLGACQQHAARPANQDEPDFAAQCQSTRQTTDPQHCQFLHQMRWRIQQNFTGAEGYAGQRCAVTIAWNASRQRYNVLATTGDEAICLKAWQTIGTTPDLPPPPADVNGQFVFNFTPG